MCSHYRAGVNSLIQNISMKYKYSKLQILAIGWLVCFTTICFINSTFVICLELYGSEDYGFAFSLPFIHCGVAWIFIIVRSVWWYTSGIRTLFMDRYIEENYPDIWKRLHPWWPVPSARLTRDGLNFIRGRYDNGTDEKLNQIKFTIRVNYYLTLWPFLLILMIWLFSYVLMVVFDRFPPQ